MRKTNWMMSEGGPLLCIEKCLEHTWGGISELTVVTADAQNDYERACQAKDYLERIQVPGGAALVLGDAPLDTAFWRSSRGEVFVVRIWNCEEDFDLDAVMRAIDPCIFDEPAEILEFSFATPDLIMFDSAESGHVTEKESVSVSVVPGRYRILTQPFDPNRSTALILHRLDRIGGQIGERS